MIRTDGTRFRVHPAQLATLEIDYKRAFVLLIRGWLVFWYDVVVVIYGLISGTYPETLQEKAAAGETRLVETDEDRNKLYEIQVAKLKSYQAQLLEMSPDPPPEEFHKVKK